MSLAKTIRCPQTTFFDLNLNDFESFLKQNQSQGVNTDLNFETESETYLKILSLILLYADDTVLLAKSQEQLQLKINNFKSYCDQWNLKVNLTKTKITVFITNKPKQFSFKFGNESIELLKYCIISKYKYLAVVFASTGSNIHAKKHLIEQANKALFYIYARVQNLDIPFDLLLELFDNTVTPILCYGSEIWGYENSTFIEQVQLFSEKNTKIRKSTPLYMLMLYGETGRYPLHITNEVRMVKFWLALKSGKNSKLSFRCLNAMNNLSIPCKWNAYIKSILDKTGFSIYWNNAETVNHKWLYKSIEQTLKDQFCQSWENSLQNSSKGYHYKMLKENFEQEFFLIYLPRSLSYCLLKFTNTFRLNTSTYVNYCIYDAFDAVLFLLLKYNIFFLRNVLYNTAFFPNMFEMLIFV